MTQPVQEPTPQRMDSNLAWGERQVRRRPAITTPQGECRPWVWLHDGAATNCPDNTFVPIPFEFLDYDPELVVKGDIFDWVTTDVGDTGNFRFELETLVEGFFYYSLRSQMEQTTSNGTEPFAYFMQQLRVMNLSETTTFYENRSSADWLRDDVDGGTSNAPGEQFNNGFLNTSDITYVTGSRIWKSRAQQTTGVDRDLSGMDFFVMYMCSTDATTWEQLIIPGGS